MHGDVADKKGLNAVTSCEMPEGYTDNTDDCNDDDKSANPDGEERCDGIDNDCDTLVDSADSDVDPSDTATWYLDADTDVQVNLNPGADNMGANVEVTRRLDADNTVKPRFDMNSKKQIGRAHV